MDKDNHQKTNLFRSIKIGNSKIVMYEFWYDYVKPKYRKKLKLCYIDTDYIIVYIKTEDLYIDIAKEVET